MRLSGQQSGLLPPSSAFTPLLDVPVDSYASFTVRSRSLSPSPTHSFHLTESTHSTQRGHQPHRSTNRRENGASRYDEVSLLSVSDRGDVVPERGRSPDRNGRGRAGREASPDSTDGRRIRQEGFTEVSVRVPSQRRARTPLADVFEAARDMSPSTGRGSSQQMMRHSQNGHNLKKGATLPPEGYEIRTLNISKTKHSLGEYKTETRIKKSIKFKLNVFSGISWYLCRKLFKICENACSICYE